MDEMKARSAVLAAFAVFATAGLSACGGSSEKRVTPVPFDSAPKAFQMLQHPHRYALNQVEAAFASQGITLRKMHTPYGAHVVVLFDPTWHAPTGFHLDGGPPSDTYISVFVHASAGASVVVQDGNVYVANGPGEGRRVNAALNNLDRSRKH